MAEVFKVSFIHPTDNDLALSLVEGKRYQNCSSSIRKFRDVIDWNVGPEKAALKGKHARETGGTPPTGY